MRKRQEAEDQVRRSRPGEHVIGLEASRLGDGVLQPIRFDRRRGSQKVGQEFPEPGEDTGRRIKPGVEHVGAHQVPKPFYMPEVVADRVDEISAMDSSRGH